MTPSIEAIFVYGTLKPGEAYYQRYCQGSAVSATPAQVQGALYHLPQGYPALTFGEHRVRGSLLHLVKGASLNEIDQFESYDPALEPTQNEYQRLAWPVMDLRGQLLEYAWMYVMAGSKVSRYGGVWIPTGFWSRTLWPSIRP